MTRTLSRRAIRGTPALAGLLLLALLVVSGGVFAAPNRPAGPVLAIIPLDAPAGPLVVDASTHRAFLVEPKADRPNGVVLVLDAESGALLRTTTVGYEPRAARRGRGPARRACLRGQRGRYDHQRPRRAHRRR